MIAAVSPVLSPGAPVPGNASVRAIRSSLALAQLPLALPVRLSMEQAWPAGPFVFATPTLCGGPPQQAEAVNVILRGFTWLERVACDVPQLRLRLGLEMAAAAVSALELIPGSFLGLPANA